MRRILTLATFGLLAFCAAAGAATIQWNNSGTNWAIGSDWVGGTPPADDLVTDIAAFGSTGTSQVNPILTAARSVNGVSFLTNAYSYTVSGSPLTIGSSGIASGAVFSTETFSNQINIGVPQQWTNAGGLTISGPLDLYSAAVFPQSPTPNAVVTRTLSLNGGGATVFSGVVQNSAGGTKGNLTYSGDANGSLSLTNANTYNGLTTITSGSLLALHDGAFGTSDVSLTGNSAMVTLQSGTLNDYIANTATLSVSNGATIALSFVGTDVVGAFVVGGVSQPAGIYNSVNEPGLLTGTGTITVVPEPSAAASMILGGGLLVGLHRLLRRRRV